MKSLEKSREHVVAPTTDQKVRGSSPLGRASPNPLHREGILLYLNLVMTLKYWEARYFCPSNPVLGV
jgi:hypothetical protein